MPYLWPFPIKMYVIRSYRLFKVLSVVLVPNRPDKRGMSVLYAVLILLACMVPVDTS